MSDQIEIPWILLLLRSVVGTVMIYYGWPKVRNLKSNANDFVKMGFRPGIFWGTLIAIVEFFGGIGMLLGFYAELAATLFAFQMMVGTFWKLKIRRRFSDYSYDIQLFRHVSRCYVRGSGHLFAPKSSRHKISSLARCCGLCGGRAASCCLEQTSA